MVDEAGRHARPSSWWQRARMAYAYLRSQDPVRLVAFWRALAGVAVAAGVTGPDRLDARVSAVIGAVWVVVTFAGAERTRQRVVPVDNVPPQYWADNQPH